MQLLVQFDLDADIVEVPQCVVDERELLRRKFWKWISNQSIKHKYWVVYNCNDGIQRVGLHFRGDAFVEWLNTKYLKNNSEKAYVLQTHVDIDEYRPKLPSIFF